jgi:hypothetical protein
MKTFNTCASLLSLCACSGLLTAQTLKITEPKDGTVMHPGQTMTVVVEASPQHAFYGMLIVGADAIGLSGMLYAPPYRFSMAIPSGARPRRYTLTARGFTEPGQSVSSDRVEIRVERLDSPLRLTAEPSVLRFQNVGDQCSVAPVGEFVDAEWVDLGESSNVRYIPDNPNVVTVAEGGLVTAAGPGSAKITIQYNGRSTVVPVKVKKPPDQK